MLALQILAVAAGLGLITMLTIGGSVWLSVRAFRGTLEDVRATAGVVDAVFDR